MTWVSVVELLQRAQLPTEDLTRAPDLTLWVLEIDAQVAGAVGLEGSGTGRAPAAFAGGRARTPAARARHRRSWRASEREARGAGTEQLGAADRNGAGVLSAARATR